MDTARCRGIVLIEREKSMLKALEIYNRYLKTQSQGFWCESRLQDSPRRHQALEERQQKKTLLYARAQRIRGEYANTHSSFSFVPFVSWR